VDWAAVPAIPANTPVYADADQVIRRRGNVVLAVSMASPNAQSLKAMATAIEQLDSQVLVMVVIASAARAPDGPTRDAIRQITVRLQHRIAAFVYVVEGEGFAAAAIRSAISFISMFARYSFPQRVMTTVEEGATWLVRQLPATGAHSHDASRIVRTIEGMRAELRPREPERRSDQA